jgi:hypothetical protein
MAATVDTQVAPGVRTRLDLCASHERLVHAARGDLKAAAAMICPSTIASTLTGSGSMRCTSKTEHDGLHQNWRHTWDDAGNIYARWGPKSEVAPANNDEVIEDDEDSEDATCPDCGGELFPVEDDDGSRTDARACSECSRVSAPELSRPASDEPAQKEIGPAPPPKP